MVPTGHEAKSGSVPSRPEHITGAYAVPHLLHAGDLVEGWSGGQRGRVQSPDGAPDQHIGIHTCLEQAAQYADLNSTGAASTG
jgi:hypothetical protein